MVMTPGDSPISFQCSAQLTIHEVVKKGVAQAGKGQRSSGTHWLKVCGRDEYLDPAKRMVDYVYVHNCLKLYAEVKVQIIDQKQLPKSLACQPQTVSIPPAPPTWADPSAFHSISEQELNTLLDSYVTKAAKFRSVVQSHAENPSPVPIPALAQTVISCVKLLCERLLYVEPPSLSNAIFSLRRACKSASGLHGDSSGFHGNSSSGGVAEGGSDDGCVVQETMSLIVTSYEMTMTSLINRETLPRR
jgi:hypothetical protein